MDREKFFLFLYSNALNARESKRKFLGIFIALLLLRVKKETFSSMFNGFIGKRCGEKLEQEFFKSLIKFIKL
jgi:hypothetical protein